MAEAAKKEKNLPVPAGSVPATPPKITPSRDWVGVGLLCLVTINLLALSGMGYFMQKMWVQIREVSTLAKKTALAPVPEKEVRGFGKEIEPHKMGPLYNVESILVNINGDQGPKFLQVQMDLEMNDPAVEEELKKKKPIVRDAILVLLSSRSYKELREPEGMKKVRSDLLRSINNLLNTGKIKEIYFQQFHFN